MSSSHPAFNATALIEDAKALIGQGYGCVLPLLLDAMGELYTPLRRDAFSNWFGAARTESEVDALFRQYAPAGIALGIERHSKFVAVRSAEGIDPFNAQPFSERVETVGIVASSYIVYLFQRDTAAIRPVPKRTHDFTQVDDYVIVPPTIGYAYATSPFHCNVLAQAPFQLNH